MNTSEKRPAKSGEAVTRKIAGETIIVPVKGGVGHLASIYTLNEVGSSIWHWIDGATTARQIVQKVCAEYDIAEAEAEKDVQEYLSTLESAGLIEPLHENGD